MNIHRPARQVIALASPALLLVAPTCALGNGSTKAGSIPAGVRAELLKDARSVALTYYQERRPYDIQAVLTTERRARRLEDQTRSGHTRLVGGDTQVYFIAMKGRFTFSCEGPPGAHCKPVPVLMLMVSTSTKEVLASTRWGEKYPSLKSVGVPVHLGGSVTSARKSMRRS